MLRWELKDRSRKQDILKIIDSFSEKGITVLLVEQYLDFVLENTNKLYVMEKGEIVYANETKLADKDEVQRLMTE